MKRGLLTAGLVVLSVAWTAPLFAQTNLASLSDGYSKNRESISWKWIENRVQLRSQYTNELNKLEESLAQEGSLDGVLAVRAEREAFVANEKDGGAPVEPSIEAITGLRERYRRAVAAVAVQEDKDIIAAAEKYVEELRNLESELTKENKIDEAIVIQSKRKQVMNAADVVAAVAAVKAAAEKPDDAKGGDVDGSVVEKDKASSAADAKGKPLFNGVNLAGWKVTGGKWRVVDGKIAASGSIWGSGKLLLVGQPQGSNYEFSVRVQTSKGGRAGVVFHVYGAKREYIYGHSVGLVEVGGRGTLITPVTDLSPGSWRLIRIVVRGVKVRIYEGDKVVGTREDLQLDSGPVGLWAGSGETMFDEPKIKILAPVSSLQ